MFSGWLREEGAHATSLIRQVSISTGLKNVIFNRLKEKGAKAHCNLNAIVCRLEIEVQTVAKDPASIKGSHLEVALYLQVLSSWWV